eukprot:1162003-Pelagomonas_calceolata.AAC.12
MSVILSKLLCTSKHVPSPPFISSCSQPGIPKKTVDRFKPTIYKQLVSAAGSADTTTPRHQHPYSHGPIQASIPCTPTCSQGAQGTFVPVQSRAAVHVGKEVAGHLATLLLLKAYVWLGLAGRRFGGRGWSCG